MRLAFALATSSALLHCSGVDGITTAPDPDAGDDTQTDAGRHHDSGSSSSADASASRDSGSRTEDSGSTTDSGTSDAHAADPGPILWGIDSTAIYSVSASTGAVHRVATFSGGCTSLNDIAIDSSGQLYGAETWDSTDDAGNPISYYTPAKITVNTAASTATCTPVDPSVHSQQASLGFRAGGDMLGVSFVDSTYVATVNPYTAATQANLFQLDVVSFNGDDVACSSTGTCYGSVGMGGTPNVVAFSDTLSGSATSVWSGASTCWGMAYAANAAYCFVSDGSIMKLDLTTSPATATTLALHSDGSTALPTYWSGAASQPD